MNKKTGFGLALILILGISIGYWSTKRTVGMMGLSFSDSKHSFYNNNFKDSIWDVNGYEEYRILERYTYAELEAMVYQIQKKKEREPFKSRILIHFYGSSMESTKIQKMVENKFGDLGLSYLYTTNERRDRSVRLGIIY
jgi:GTPase SAR1 family protein